MRAALLLVTLIATAALAGDGWRQATTGDITVKVRGRSGTAVQEVHAQAVVEAPARAVQQALLDCERYRHFMPYVTESRYLEGTNADAEFVVYTRLVLPSVSSRDYIVRSRTLQVVDAQGTGEFRSEWSSEPDALPARANVVRVRLNEGSWRVVARPDGKSDVTYRFIVDPGGMVPGFVADFANRSALPDTFKAIEREAQRRAAGAADAGR